MLRHFTAMRGRTSFALVHCESPQVKLVHFRIFHRVSLLSERRMGLMERSGCIYLKHPPFLVALLEFCIAFLLS